MGLKGWVGERKPVSNFVLIYLFNVIIYKKKIRDVKSSRNILNFSVYKVETIKYVLWGPH